MFELAIHGIILTVASLTGYVCYNIGKTVERRRKSSRV